jgi:hypothetical protein
MFLRTPPPPPPPPALVAAVLAVPPDPPPETIRYSILVMLVETTKFSVKPNSWTK